MVLPDGQIVYVVPQNVPQQEEDQEKKRARTMFGSDDPKKNLQTIYDANVKKYRKEFVPNPGLDPNLQTFRGVVKQVPDDNTGYGFITSPEMQQKFGRDAFLHNKNCPWLHFTELEKNETVLFQIELNERQQPTVMRFMKCDMT